MCYASDREDLLNKKGDLHGFYTLMFGSYRLSEATDKAGLRHFRSSSQRMHPNARPCEASPVRRIAGNLRKDNLSTLSIIPALMKSDLDTIGDYARYSPWESATLHRLP